MVRWLLPFTASFIHNQIMHHKRYVAKVVFTEKRDGPFFERITNNLETFNPYKGGFDELVYKKTRVLSQGIKNRLEDYISNFNPEILHVHYGVDCLVYSEIIRNLRIPTCVSFYGYDCTSFPRRFFGYGRILLKQKVFLNPSVKIILAMTEDMKRDLINLGCPEEKIVVHYYGTETDSFYREKSTHKKENIDLLIISGLHEKKGHLFLLNAFARLCSHLPDQLHLHIVGEGPMRRPIEEKLNEMRLNNVTLHGAIEYGSKQHMHFLEMANIFVHPSLTAANGDKEGIPGSIIEAMASGLPVISTYHGGIPYIIEHGKTGLLVDERDEVALENALGRMVRDLDLRNSIAQQGQQYAKANLDIERKEIELEQIYDEMKA